MKLNILLATIDGGIERVGEVLLKPLPDVNYIISHQLTAETCRLIPPELKREDVIISQIEGRGLARNRNNALNLADGDIALLADDDLRYKPEYFQTVINAFEIDRAMDLACFKIATPVGEPEYKDYSTHPYILNEESHHYISSIEIAFRPEAIKAKKITFDERFGLGSPLIRYGEEAVFIYDCIRAGLRVKYIPEYIVEHSMISSARALPEFDRERNIFKGAYDARRYGWKAVPAAFIDLLRLWPRLKKDGKAPLAYFRERLSGASYILHK